MKKILALLFIVVMCLAVVSCNRENNSNKDILGEWISIDKEDAYVKLFEDGTGELKEDGVVFDFEWEYDAENQNYRTNIASSEFKRSSEDGKSIARRNMCELCYDKMNTMQDALDK